MSVGMVKIVLNRRVSLKDSILITGFHGIGLTGYLTLRFLVSSLKPKRVGYILTRNMPPYVCRSSEGIRLPYEIYYLERGKSKFIFIMFNIPLSEEDFFDVPYKIAEWAINGKFKEAFLVGGLNKKAVEDYAIRIIHTRAYRNELNFVDLNVKYLEERIHVVGPLALMLAYFEVYDFPAVTVLPCADTDKPDFRAASEAIRIFNSIYGFNINVEPLEEEAKRIEMLEKAKPKIKIQTKIKGQEFFRASYIA